MVRIIADSTCDLPDTLLAQYNITLLPLHIVLGAASYKDRLEITPVEIYAWSNRTKASPKTSAPNVAQITDLIRPYYDQGDEILLMSISENMSSAASNMHLAAQSFDMPERIRIIESSNLSTGFGLLAIEAAYLAKAGKSADEIAAHIETLKPLIRASFVVDTLTFLERGGRCSGAAALAGSILKLHPKIVVQDGKMHVSHKYRGSIQKAIFAYVDDLIPSLMNAQPRRVFITHSGCDAATVDTVFKRLSALNHFDEILVTQAGGVISSHCGPGTLGVLFIAQGEE